MITDALFDRKFPLLGKAGGELTQEAWLAELCGVGAVEDLDYGQSKTVYRELLKLERDAYGGYGADDIPLD